MANPDPSANRPPPKLYTAFGDTMPLVEWAEDERCECSYTLLRKRVQERGWDVETALSNPARGYCRKGERKLKPKRRKPKPQGHLVSAWGLTMSLKAWSEQSYVPVSVATLWRRIVRDEWPAEAALSLKPGQEYVPPPKPPMEMSLGEYMLQGLAALGRQRRLRRERRKR